MPYDQPTYFDTSDAETTVLNDSEFAAEIAEYLKSKPITRIDFVEDFATDHSVRENLLFNPRR